MKSTTPRGWRPTLSTWLLGSAVLIVLIASVSTGGVGGLLIWLGLVGLGTMLYVAVSKRPSWAGLPRSRAFGAVGAAAALVVLLVGSGVYGATHPASSSAPSVASATNAVHASSAASTPRPSSTRIAFADLTGDAGPDVQTQLAQSGYRVVFETADGSAVTPDLGGMSVVSQDPPAGTPLAAGATVHVVLAPTATPSPTPAPVVVPAPAAPPAPPPAPVQKAPAPPAASAVSPGAFCPNAQMGQSGVAANGRTYICGGKGADANGHYHWNVP